MNQSCLSDFAYVGGRPYIRGVDVLRGFLEPHAVDVANYPSEIQLLKLLRELKSNGIWRHSHECLGAADGLEASATLEYTDAQKNKHRALFFETGARITRTMPDAPTRVSSVVCDSPFAGRAAIVPPIDAMVMLDGLVTANKTLHAITLQERGLSTGSIRFVYVERFPVSLPLQSNSVELKITHRGAREKDGRTYTLNVADFGLEGGSVRAIICFSFETEKQGS